MDESTERSRINQALEQCLPSYLSAEAEQEIRQRFGDEIAQQVRAIYRDALDCPVDWSRATMDSALKLLAEHLHTHYPWLTEKARSALNYCFVMAWK